MKRDPFANQWHNTEMKVNGLSCTLHMPRAVERQFNADGSERTVSLPPGNPRSAFAVDEYKTCPDSWMHGSAKASSYFVPILADHGMWLDFNGCRSHTHDVAVVVSVQGVNPLTGRKVDPIRLEQYRENCPVHNTPFKQDLFCDSCKFKWHPQNYIASNVTPNGYLWIDGFRTEDGTVRQWYFTEEEAKGVASQLIGQERVFAIGIAFYLSKNPKPIRQQFPVYLYSFGGGYGGYGGASPVYFSAGDVYHDDCLETVVTCSATAFNAPTATDYSGSIRCLGENTRGLQAEVEKLAKKLEIGAGAKIYQEIHRDVENLDFWQDEPAGMIYINYCDVDTAERIIQAGKREESKDGFLSGLNLK